MKSLALPIAVFIAVIFAGFVLVFLPGKSSAPTTDNTNATTTVVSGPGNNLVGIADLIEVTSLKPGDSLSSTTLTITGRARGNWYFEATFPIEIKNASGTTVAAGHANAQSDWMTTEFVPFSATLTYPKQSIGSVGTVVLKKDNPSGDPARDQSVSIPIVFK